MASHIAIHVWTKTLVRLPLRSLLALTLALLIAPRALFAAAEPDADVGKAPPTLAGRFLVAAPGMPAARFQKLVIVIVRHGPDGGMGLVINRPAGDNPWASLLTILGDKSDGVTGTFPLFSGGPVQPELFCVLHSSDYRTPDTTALTGDISTTAKKQIMHDMIAGKGPNKSLITFGYVGWRPGQLEGELGIKAWFLAPLDAKLVFDADRDTLWEQLVAAQGPRLAPP